MKKKVLSVLCAVTLILSMLGESAAVFASQLKHIDGLDSLRSAFTTREDAAYVMDNDFFVKNSGITTDVVLDGGGHILKSSETGAGATIYQNEYVNSVFSNVAVRGNTKPDVGIWLSSGSMTFNDSSIYNYTVKTVNCSAVAIAGNSTLTLNNTRLYNNSDYDINVMGTATLNINKGTELDRIHIKSNYVSINIGRDWSGSFEMDIDTPTLKQIGTVAQGADISGITISKDGYYVENADGRLMVRCSGERAIRFDLSGRDTLYKGSTGFLYGAAEINVPSVDLLQGLKPNTMVQKAIGGLQHPTGDATRTSSALLAAGVEDMQVYFQDTYLEWPYDAPMKNGSIDIDSYQKSVEKMVYMMICKKSSKGAKGAFLGTDGVYYTLDSERAANYSYVLFNEPDQIWFGGNLEGLERAWKQIYTAVHRIDPDARCVGPNYSGFNQNDYDKFLRYCMENNCLPEIISWHELGDISLTDFYTHYNFVEQYVEKYYTDCSYKPQFMVNEYARHYDIGSVGGLIKWLAMFEDKDMSGCMAYWAMANSLNELAADQNSPSSSWWVYHWYAQMTGSQCPMTYPSFAETRYYGVVSYDEKINMGYALFGGSEDKNGSEVVYLDNLSSTELANSDGAVNVKLYAVSFSGQQGASYAPDCIFEGAVMSGDNALRLEVTDADEMDAYFAVLTKAEEGAEIVSMTDVNIPTLSYEAEDATLLGNATSYLKIDWTHFATSGRADVGNICRNGDGIQFDVTVEEDGLYTASLFYSLQSPYVNPKTLTPDANGQNRGIGQTLPYGITVDGVRLPDIYLESTVSWIYKNHCDVDLPLSAGNHTITYTHINGDESTKGNLQLTAAIDKLDLKKIENPDSRYDFEIDLREMSNFKDGDTYRVTAVAAVAGYYSINADAEVRLSKQSIDYAKDAKTYSEISTYDIPVENTVYLSKGANTIVAQGAATRLFFEYDAEKTENAGVVITADEFTLHGNNPSYRKSSYADSGKVVSNIGIGQTPYSNDTGKRNYITFKVNADSEGVYNLALRYTNDEPAPVMLKADKSTYIHPYNIDLVERYAQIEVNGAEPETVYFRNTMSWDTFRTVDVQVKLNAGENTIKIYNDNSYQFSSLVNSTAPEIDTVTIAPLSYAAAVKKVPVPAKSKHTYKSSESTTRATTSKDGKVVATYTCTECGYSYSKTVSAIPKASSVTLSTSTYTYDGKAKKPTVTVKDSKGNKIATSNYTVAYTNNTKVGKASAKITFKGNYSGTKTLSFTIKPKATTLSALTAKSKGFAVKWKKQPTQTTGYQIQYSTSSKFRNAKTVTVSKTSTTSKTISKLKAKKKYYVRIRTYKTVNGTKYYSSWSKAKTVTTKK